MNYVKALRFDERPDYIFLQNLFSNLLISTYNEPFCFDWLLEVMPRGEAPNVSKRKINLIYLSFLKEKKF